MKKTITLVMLTLFVGILSGCGSEDIKEVQDQSLEANKNELVMAIGSEPEEGFDPTIGWGRYGSPLFQSTLIDTDEEMNIIYDLATGYQVSEDSLSWEFTIRDDASFTDGEKVSAEDIVYTFQTAKESGSIVDLTNMKSVQAPEEDKVVFTLEKPDSTFVYTIVATGIVPKHLHDENYGENPVGSGPFILEQWDKEQQIIMRANQDYYGKVPEIEKVTILFMEEDTALASAKAGNLDVAVTAANMADQEIEGMDLAVIETIDNRGITLPYLEDKGETNEKGYPLGNNVTSDIAIRRALSYGIDRDALIEDVINGFGRPAYTESDGMPWSNPEAKVDYDFEKAQSILEEGGWLYEEGSDIRSKDGIQAEFNLLYVAGDSTRQALATASALEAEKLGIKITTEGTSWDVIEEKMYSQAVLMGWGAQNPKETYLLYHSDNMGKDYYNPEMYSSQKTDEYIENAMAAKDPEEAMKNWQNAHWDGETGIATKGESPWVWLVNVDHLYYIREGLDIGQQKIHPHGHAWPLVANLKDWKWKND